MRSIPCLVPTTPPVFTVRAQLTYCTPFIWACFYVFGTCFSYVGATSASRMSWCPGVWWIVCAPKRPKHAEEQVQRWYHWWQTDGQGVRRCFAFTRYYAVKRRTILQDTNLGNFNDDQIADWLLLLETLLGWVQWLKSEKM
jgi:hypothetical protein